VFEFDKTHQILTMDDHDSPRADDTPDFTPGFPRLYPATKIFLGATVLLILAGLFAPSEDVYPDHLQSCLAGGDGLISCIHDAHPAGTSARVLRAHLRQMGFVRMPAGPTEGSVREIYTSRRPGQIFASEIVFEADPEGRILAYPEPKQ
jgi:hypothetical protein